MQTVVHGKINPTTDIYSLVCEPSMVPWKPTQTPTIFRTHRTDEPPHPGQEGNLAGRYTTDPWPRRRPRHTGTRRLCYTTLQHINLFILLF